MWLNFTSYENVLYDFQIINKSLYCYEHNWMEISSSGYYFGYFYILFYISTHLNLL